MRNLAALGCMAAVLAAMWPARADVVTDWNAAAFDVMKAANVGGAPAARALAIMHVSMADAVGAVNNRYTRYAYKVALQPTASAEVAASAAARSALLALLPAQQAKIDAAHAAAVAAAADGAAKDAAIKLRPGPPPALASAEYARDYNETKDFGGMRSTQRTAAQSEAVKFWSQDNLPLAWHQAARQLATARMLNLADNARLFALLSVGLANTFIVDWDVKFHYNFWRPVTAIQNDDQDDNPATERDAGWTPFNVTPMHPEYPSQAAIAAGAASAVLAHALGERNLGPFTVTDSADAKLTRPFASVSAMADEHRLVRIWGGIHFRSSLEVSERMGRALVEQLMQTTYAPVR